MRSEAYPDARWGFTTQNFMVPIPTSLQASLAFVSYARQAGFQWVELRDRHAVLTLDECKAIAEHARANGIEIIYSVQRGLLADDFWEVFARGAANVAVFDGPRFYRALASRGAEPRGWSDNEFARLTSVANEAAARASALGIRFTVENAEVALDGRDQPYWGMGEFLQQTDPAVMLQLDTANLFTGQVSVSPEQARAFIETHAGRIAYVHVKSARDGVPLRWLDGNPLAFSEIFDVVYPQGVRYIAIELGPDDDAARIYHSMEQSITHLVQSGVLQSSLRPDTSAGERMAYANGLGGN